MQARLRMHHTARHWNLSSMPLSRALACTTACSHGHAGPLAHAPHGSACGPHTSMLLPLAQAWGDLLARALATAPAALGALLDGDAGAEGRVLDLWLAAVFPR